MTDRHIAASAWTRSIRTCRFYLNPQVSPDPEPLFIASDADYVDYITELMGGFGMPAFLKQGRVGKQYLFLGMRFTRDTERMVMSEITIGCAGPAGWALIVEPTEKERRFCAKKQIEIIEMPIEAFLQEAQQQMAVA